MNRIRKMFAAEIDALSPQLHETYRRVGVFQKDRTKRNAERLLAQLDDVAPHLDFFRPHVPDRKQGYFFALADPYLSTSDRIIALDVAVGALHIDFPVERAYMHQESARLRTVLEQSRWDAADGATPPPAAWLSGTGASPGVVTGPAHIATRTSDFRRIPPGAVMVTMTPRPEVVAALHTVVAVVAERGGMLSHAAIVSRELGIPCVVGAANATRRIRPGQQITVDGAAGVEPFDRLRDALLEELVESSW